ncbi:MAG TPA: class I SAM-dependent methyltransferase [Isosphaeraceae bacterium]|nr:class I SAM-dependent methyltransferase [Isosphaeraceae bacterium]
MGFYSRVIFPRLCEWVMRDPKMAGLRSEALAQVRGEVIEIGFGTGLNLDHYSSQVRRIVAVDPGEGMNRLARKRIVQSRIEVDLHSRSAERLAFEEETFDWVVSTWTLCSVPDVTQAVSEVYRVLRPGGRFVFVEHGLSDDPSIQRWQRRLNPIQRLIGDGCRLDVDVDAVIRSQPFRTVAVDRFLFDNTPRTHGSMYRGVATK